MAYLTGFYAELIDVGPDDGRVVSVVATDLDRGYLDLPRPRGSLLDDESTAGRWAWDGTVNHDGHYRFRRVA